MNTEKEQRSKVFHFNLRRVENDKHYGTNGVVAVVIFTSFHTIIAHSM